MKNSEYHIDPERVPKKKLSSGDRIPVVGLGTFGSDKYGNDVIAAAVKTAIGIGFRHIDCAAVYGNEREVGQQLHAAMQEGLTKREDLWITSKLWNDRHHDVVNACKESLSDLRLDYLDLYLVHWPFPNFHAKGATVESRDPHAHPFLIEEFMECWSHMEELVKMGLVRNIGVSNMTVPKMKLMLERCHIRPVCVEMELHPHFQQRTYFNYLLSEGIQPIGFCPIGSPNRPERDRTAADTCPTKDPVILQIAEAHNVHPAVICIKWAVQNGQIPIPFSVKAPQLYSNLKCVTEDPLTTDEMQAIATIDKNCRLIKGQVFCWKGATWQDLWDEDGNIKGW